MKFFNPTAKFKEMLLLQHIEKKPNTSQHDIAKEIDAASSMVNVYINRLEEEGYLLRDYKSSKVVDYNITPKGIKRKNYLSITYFNELLDLYRLAEDNIESFLVKLEEKGYRNVLFYGAGEVAETILSVINERGDKPLSVIALVDDSELRQRKKLMGYEVIPSEEMHGYYNDGVVITSYTFEDVIKEKLEDMDYPMDQVELFFSGL